MVKHCSQLLCSLKHDSDWCHAGASQTVECRARRLWAAGGSRRPLQPRPGVVLTGSGKQPNASYTGCAARGRCHGAAISVAHQRRRWRPGSSDSGVAGGRCRRLSRQQSHHQKQRELRRTTWQPRSMPQAAAGADVSQRPLRRGRRYQLRGAAVRRRRPLCQLLRHPRAVRVLQHTRAVVRSLQQSAKGSPTSTGLSKRLCK